MRRINNAIVVKSLSNQLGREEIADSLAVKLVVQVNPDVIEEFTGPRSEECSVVAIVLGRGVMDLLVLYRCALLLFIQLLSKLSTHV